MKNDRRLFLGAALALALLPVSARSAEGPLTVLVGTYTDQESRGIYRFRFDEATGVLTADGLAAETKNPSFLTSDSKGRFLFAVNETDPSGGVSAFAVDAKTAALTLINQQPSGGGSPCHLTLDHTGRFLLVANYGGSAAVLPVGPDGKLSPAVTRIAPEGRGPQPNQDASHVHGVYLDPANRLLLVPDLGIDKVLLYRFDAKTGSLTPGDPPAAALAAGAGPRHLALSPDNRFVYVVNEIDSTVATFAFDAEQGRLEGRGTVSTLPAGFKGKNTTAEIAVHPSGRFVYASNRGHDSIAVFTVDAASGALRQVEVVPVGGREPRHFAIAPSGRWLLAGHQNSDGIAVFRLDPATGRLASAGATVRAPRPVDIFFLPR
jgi:6-phosphogluconolactonase